MYIYRSLALSLSLVVPVYHIRLAGSQQTTAQGPLTGQIMADLVAGRIPKES